METLVIDLSHWQETPDFCEMKASGLVGVILKATEGSTYTDPTYRDRKEAALEAGLKVASYHFMRPGDQDADARRFVEVVAPALGERLVLDFEDPDCDAGDVEEGFDALRDCAPYCELSLYASSAFLSSSIPAPQVWLEDVSLWVANYTSNPEPKPWGPAFQSWALWQYTDAGRYPGCVGNLDLNRFNGSAEACALWMGPTLVAEPPPMILPTVTVTVHSDLPIEIIIETSGHARLA